MKKRIISIMTVALLLFGILPSALATSGSLTNFTRLNTYQTGLFKDITSSQWYASYVQAAYEYGLVNGKTPTTYEANATLTVAEAVKLAVCLNSIYETGRVDISGSASGPWYKPYVDKALAVGILTGDSDDYNVPITRSGFALILSRALPDEALHTRNTVDDDAIPDVPLGLSYSDAVYKLYRAGVLTGSDSDGRFMPQATIKRSEVAAVVTRMASESFRKNVTLKLDLTATQLFNKCAPSVFFIEIKDIKGKSVKSGSGFFISDTGLAVTNFHVINGAASAIITMNDGQQYDVAGVYGYDKQKDLAIIQIKGTGFQSLQLADSGSVAIGDAAYAIGSPLGYKNTISVGIISGLGRTVNDMSFIQTTAAISPGSSGGVLLNSAGKVIGITTATAVGAQNINLALPSNLIGTMDKTNMVTLQSILPKTVYYADDFPAPDFGAYINAPIYKQEDLLGDKTYYYKISDISKNVTETLDGYAALLEQNNFSAYGYAIEEGKIIEYYTCGSYNLLLTIGVKKIDGVDCVRVQIMSI